MLQQWTFCVYFILTMLHFLFNLTFFSLLAHQPIHSWCEWTNICPEPNSRSNLTKQPIIKAPTLQQLIMDTFEKALKEFHQARITSFTKDRRRAWCYFYGSHDNGCVESKEIIPFEHRFSTIRLIKVRNQTNFVKGVREIEIENGIPEHLSSVREELSIQ